MSDRQILSKFAPESPQHRPQWPLSDADSAVGINATVAHDNCCPSSDHWGSSIGELPSFVAVASGASYGGDF